VTRTCQGRCKVCELGEDNESLRAEVATLDRMHRLALDQRDQARVERDRLADGIREHRDYEFPEGSFTPTERFSQAVRASERLWALLDVATDDREDGR